MPTDALRVTSPLASTVIAPACEVTGLECGFVGSNAL